MQIDYRSYPHPVLSHFSDDVLRSAFQAGIKVTTAKNTYSLRVNAKCSNRALNELIETGKAKFALHVECAATRYRNLHWSPNETFSVDVPSDRLSGKVQVCPFVLAAEDLPTYTNADFHPDYEGRTFRVRRGDVLAIDQDCQFFADKEDDPKRLPSIFTIAPSQQENPRAMDLDLEGDKIIVWLEPDLFNRYKQLALDSSLAPLLASVIVVPALVEVIEELKATTEADGLLEFEARRWYRALSKKLKEHGYVLGETTDSALAIAQEVVGNPAAKALQRMLDLDDLDQE